MILNVHENTVGNAQQLIDDLKELDDLNARVSELVEHAATLHAGANLDKTKEILSEFMVALNDVTSDTIDDQRKVYQQECDDLPERILEVV
ncbi:MAG: hypothetical protein ACPG4X_14530 [Pikeienuella sp.]